MVMISVVIPTYNRAYRIGKAINALERQTLDKNKFEVVIVDDGSTDETKKILPKLVKNIKNVRIYGQINNYGASLARNFGVRRASGQYIAFMDDDCIPNNDWLKETLKAFDRHPEASAIGGQIIVNREGGLRRTLEIFGLWLSRVLFGDSKKYGKIYSSGVVSDNFEGGGKDIQVDHWGSGNLTVRKDVFKVIRFDGWYYNKMYREETDFCTQMKKANMEIWYTPRSVVIHDLIKTRRSKKAIYFRNYNHYYFWRKFFGWNIQFFLHELFESVLYLGATIITLDIAYLYGIYGKIDGVLDFIGGSHEDRNSYPV